MEDPHTGNVLASDARVDPEVQPGSYSMSGRSGETVKNEGRLSLVKAEADALFRKREYGPAIRLYDAVFDIALASTPLELKRTVLSNRAQAYFLQGDEHWALAECDLALSSAYTLPSSPKIVTAKCYYRRARILCLFRRYEEALRDYTQYEELWVESGLEVGMSERALQGQIKSGMDEKVGEQKWIKTQLMKAIDARHMMVIGQDRTHFPKPCLPAPSRDGDGGNNILHFETDDEQPDLRLSNPLTTPLRIPLMIRAPFLLNTDHRDRFKRVTSYSEAGYPGQGTKGQTVGTILEHMSSFCAITPHGQLVNSWTPSEASIFLMTHRGRLFVIPHNTKVKDI
ncbi:hypothetical protein BOTBODRAFT_62794 [Botryobasidium botryosum FD-172 SS1]|uniref:Cns1/TTC4 wheel domain-containing protein n=1 Tax=Botryobasidium botryosum (strain FD-172 SS1) TaxID=930990 RepID=A0A067MUI8_BOTB1|nr:hypothetical protein BOTBODRAFT_62794 [Botryobasidium botryosum FD-172 SS1]